jgi:hypothetical protein
MYLMILLIHHFPIIQLFAGLWLIQINHDFPLIALRRLLEEPGRLILLPLQGFREDLEVLITGFHGLLLQQHFGGEAVDMVELEESVVELAEELLNHRGS